MDDRFDDGAAVAVLGAGLVAALVLAFVIPNTTGPVALTVLAWLLSA